MKQYFYIATLLLLLASCAGGRQAATETESPYRRKPIVEVTASELKADSALIEATTQMLLGHREEAIERYRRLLKDSATYSPAHYELGRAYLSMGWVDSALVHTRQACHLDEDNVWYRILLTRVYEMKQDPKNLLATWEDIVKRNPDVLNYYYDLSNAYLTTGNVPGSIEVLDRVERRYGVTEEVSLQKHKLWMAINKPEKARRELERLAEAMPNEVRYNAILAESYMSEKNYAKALTYYQRILAAQPNDENIHIALASCYNAMGNLQAAYNHLRLGVLNRSVDGKHRLQYLTEFMKDQKFFAAYNRECYLLADTVAAQCTEDDGHHFPYGLLLAAQERYAEAAKQFTLHLEHDKSQYAIWEALLMCESQLPDHRDQLLEHALAATELFPLHLRPYLILAATYLELGDCKQALLYINRGLMVAPSDATVNEINHKIKETCHED
jgi:tetratricopeptide (TPR) repeat protein